MRASDDCFEGDYTLIAGLIGFFLGAFCVLVFFVTCTEPAKFFKIEAVKHGAAYWQTDAEKN